MTAYRIDDYATSVYDANNGYWTRLSYNSTLPINWALYVDGNDTFKLQHNVGGQWYEIISTDGYSKFQAVNLQSMSGSLLLGDKHRVSSAGENVFFCNNDSNYCYFPVWQGVRADGSSFVTPTARQYLTSSVSSTPYGGVTASIANYSHTTVATKNYSLFQEIIKPAETYTGHLKYIVKDTNSGSLIQNIDISGCNSGVDLSIPFGNPIDVRNGTSLTIEIRKESLTGNLLSVFAGSDMSSGSAKPYRFIRSAEWTDSPIFYPGNRDLANVQRFSAVKDYAQGDFVLGNDNLLYYANGAVAKSNTQPSAASGSWGTANTWSLVSSRIVSWSSTQPYASDQIVMYSDGQLYAANAQIASGTSWSINSKASGLGFRPLSGVPTWNQNASYSKDTLVIHPNDRNLYLSNSSIAANTSFAFGSANANGSNWRPVGEPPIGSLQQAYTGALDQARWLNCNGDTPSSTTYPDLAALIATRTETYSVAQATTNTGAFGNSLIAYHSSSGRYIMTGPSRAVWYSTTPGSTWTAGAFSNTGAPTAWTTTALWPSAILANGTNIYVFVTSRNGVGADGYFLSTDNGANFTWQAAKFPAAVDVSVACVSPNGNIVLTLGAPYSDGSAYAAFNSYGGEAATTALYSTDGVSFLNSNTIGTSSSTWLPPVVGNGIVMTGLNAGTTISYSTDGGVNWNQVTVTAMPTYTRLIGSPIGFVIGGSGKTYYFSKNSVNWLTVTGLTTLACPVGAAWTGTSFLFVNGSGTTALVNRSFNGTAWNSSVALTGGNTNSGGNIAINGTTLVVAPSSLSSTTNFSAYSGTITTSLPGTFTLPNLATTPPTWVRAL